jgi:hypothetical protein
MIDPELAEGLKRIKERDGIPEAEQVRRGIKLWLKSKGVTVEAPSRSRGKRERKG